MNNRPVILANIKSEPILPMGLLYVGNALKQAGYKVEIYDLKPQEIAHAAKSIADTKPLFLGISTLTGLQTKHSALLSMAIKQLDEKLPIIWGGIHPSILPQDCLKEDYIDAVVIGEGEETVVELANAYYNGAGLKGVLGTGYSSGRDIFINEPRPKQKDIDKFSMDWSLVDIDRYIRKTYKGRRQIDFVTSRGCPFDCGFCYNSAFNKRLWRAHSLEHVLESVNRLKKIADFDDIQMQDDNFFVKEERAINIISQLKKLNVQSDYIQMRLEKVEDWIIKALIENDVERLFIGWESANPRILELINKNITREQLFEKFTLLSKFPKISTNGSAIIGFPTETWDEIGVTVDFTLFISKLIPGALINLCTYLPYPGSPIYELAKKEGFEPPKRQLDWGVFDLFDSRKLELTWLAWAGKSEREKFFRLDKYAQLLNHAKSTSPLRTLVKKIFYHFARFRLKHRFFNYPFEIMIQERFANTTKYGIPLAGNKGKFSRQMQEEAQTPNPAKIRILHLIESLGCGGAEKRLVSDLKNLDKDRFDNVVCFLYEDDYYKQDILDEKIPVYSLGMKNIYDWPHGIFKLAAIVRKHKIDIIHSQLFAANIYGRILAKFMAKPIVSTLQSCDYEPDSYLYSRKRQIVDSLTAKIASGKFIAVSDFVKESYIKRLGLKSEKFKVVHNSLDFDNFKPYSPQEIERLRQELGINKEATVILNIGRLDPPKGQNTLLSAFAKTARVLNNVKLLIVGIGPSEQELKELRDSLGLGDKVSFLGLRDDVVKLLQLCDIYISTSFREGFSMSVLEALYMKKPSIVSRMVYMPEVLKDNVTAFLVDPEDITGISGKIIEVAGSRQIAESVGQKGHLLVKENFDASKNIKLLEDVYLKLKK